jgi:glycosyltransferase involved in cell wall biosynthesis
MGAPRILALRAYWHPAETPGSRRFAAFCRHLARAGWEVTLLALRPAGMADEGVQAEQAAGGHRTLLLPHSIRSGAPLTALEQRVRKWMPVLFEEGFVQARRLVHRAAADLLRREQFDVLLTTYPTAMSLQVAHALHREFNVPWIADLRDLPDEFDSQRRHWTTRRRVARVCACCRSASGIVTVSEPLKQALGTRYGLSAPVEVVQNGFDEEAFDACFAKPDASRFDITYCGGARRGDGRSAALLGQGLALLRGRGFNLDGVRIVLVGNTDAEGMGLGPARELAVPVWKRGMVPHAESLAAMRESAMLVSLASPGAAGILTSKIFEYAMAGRPVLGIPRDHNGLDDFIHRARIGRACDTAEEVAEFLAVHVDAWRRTGRLPEADVDREHLAGFSRRVQAHRLGEIIRSCI